MNQTERRYAIDRVKQIQKDYLDTVREHLKSNLKPEPSDDEKLEHIRSGRARLVRERAQPRNGYRTAPDLFDVFEFPGESKREEANSELRAECDGRISQIVEEGRKLVDKIQLTDIESTAALALIDAFARRKF